MQSLVDDYGHDSIPALIFNRIFLFFKHCAIALGWWLGIMLLGYAINPPGIPQGVILALSIAVPLVVGFSRQRAHRDEMASRVWLFGFLWALVICLYVLSLPAGPHACSQCDATDKLARTFLSIPRPSGLLDNDGPFLATWPAAALVGYSVGARMAYRRKRPVPDRSNS